ncbi:cytochrome P450 [Dactylonectria estremocensis]|uniref:Cytochrome P450 n=1 Tax=Dactylonectria estremocensis TaxID=1079267 RepID=A0A9P9ID39_9HYPO|nr:cytochrome P450 [Dactylonectria estremocensis]
MGFLAYLIQDLVVLGRAIYLGPFLILLGWTAWSVAIKVQFEKQYRLPNLVPGLPIIGNARQIPKQDPCLHFAALARKYGEMFTVKIGGSYWLFLNSSRVANELLEKRAAIYSSRMELPMAYDLASRGYRTLLMPYGDLWRRERRVMHQILNINRLNVFEPLQDVESKTLLWNYLQTPDSWWKAHGTYSGSVIMSVVFGRRAGLNDLNLKASLAVSDEFVEYLMPGRVLVDHLPFLTKIPWLKSLQPWRWYGDGLYQRTRKVYQKEIDELRERRKLGTQKPCFMSEFLDMGQDGEFSHEELLFMAGALMEAGTDTTRVSLNQCVAGAILWPDWVTRAREELDQVCGANAERLPNAQDGPRLPIIKGAVKESIRWKPIIGTTGIPHALTRDDEFEGHKIPAGTVVTYNHWFISNSADEYEQPERFWPERFINDELDKPLKGHLGFGAGRRVCVGYNVAMSNLLIALSRIIYCFDFIPVPGASMDTSKPLDSGEQSPPFQVEIKVRSEAHQKLIERECCHLAI